MIVVKLKGGLGNQLFQYAIGRSLSSRYKTNLLFDLTYLEESQQQQNMATARSYMLDSFAIKNQIINVNQVKEIQLPNIPLYIRLKYKFVSKQIPYYYFPIQKERNYFFDPNYIHFPKDCYLDGYWQSEKYFDNVRSLIIEELKFPEIKLEYHKKIWDNITKTEAVAMHIRRTDYITNVSANKVHGTCGLDYFHSAIELVISRVSDVHFFIFSDDYEWCVGNLKISFPHTFVKSSSEQPYDELFLMSQCNHYILSNSSFSWWGAWLNKKKGDIVIAPEFWFRDERNTSDLYLSHWEVLKNL